MKTRVAGLLFGLAFGFWLCWARFTSFDTIHLGLRLQQPYLWLMFGTAVIAASVGMRALRASGARTLLDGDAITLSPLRPRRDHLVGALIFGVGWAIAGTCPGPAAAQVGHGQLAGLFTMAGILAGVALRGRMLERQAHGAARAEPHVPTGACEQA